MLAEEQLATLPKPRSQALKAFKHIFFNGTKDQSFPSLDGNSSQIYDIKDDLAAVKVLERPDRMTAFAEDHLGFLFV
jgi:hypothetical protein